MKFKVGDKVKAIKDIGCYESNIPKGSICTVLEVSDCICKVLDFAGRQWTSVIDSFELTAPIISEIKEKKLSCVIHTKTKNEAKMLIKLLGVNKNYIFDPTDAYIDFWGQNKENTCYRIINGKVSEASNCQIYAYKGETIYDFSDLFATGGAVSIHDLPISEWYNPMRLTFENGSFIEALPQSENPVRGENHFCNGFRGGKKPADVDGGLVSIHDVDTHELWTTPFIIPKDRLDALVDAWAKLGCTTFRVSPNEADELIKKEFNVKWIEEEKKMPTKFTFYVTEGTRIDKTCNKTIPTITTHVEVCGFDDSLYRGTATCDKVDYSERQGVLEAFANAMLGDNFERNYNKAIKWNKSRDLFDRTCPYCGQVFDTIEDCKAHEDWHVECRKARHERYLLRKRAKEIAFEEQAQKMAKEMLKEDK